MRRLSLDLVSILFTVAACGQPSSGARDGHGAVAPSVEAAKASSPLQRAAASAVENRFPGQLWTNVREKQGLREGAVCAEVAGQQVIYREKRELLIAQSDFPNEEWQSLYENWCINTPYR